MKKDKKNSHLQFFFPTDLQQSFPLPLPGQGELLKIYTPGWTSWIPYKLILILNFIINCYYVKIAKYHCAVYGSAVKFNWFIVKYIMENINHWAMVCPLIIIIIWPVRKEVFFYLLTSKSGSLKSICILRSKDKMSGCSLYNVHCTWIGRFKPQNIQEEILSHNIFKKNITYTV